MSESQHNENLANTPERALSEDFLLGVALDAARAGVFDITPFPHPNSYPQTMLEAPLTEDLAHIGEYRHVEADTMQHVRANLVYASRALLPAERVQGYFEQQLATPNPFYSRGIGAAVNAYNPKITPDGSVREEDVYTPQEITDGIKMTYNHPAIALAILSHTGILRDYLDGLDSALHTLSARTNESFHIDQTSLENYRTFADFLGKSSLLQGIMPHLAQALGEQMRAYPAVVINSLVTEELLQHAVDAVIQNGWFESFIDGIENTEQKRQANHILSLAIKAIHNRPGSGQLLYRLYARANDLFKAGDQRVADQISTIRVRSWQALAGI